MLNTKNKKLYLTKIQFNKLKYVYKSYIYKYMIELRLKFLEDYSALRQQKADCNMNRKMKRMLNFFRFNNIYLNRDRKKERKKNNGLEKAAPH